MHFRSRRLIVPKVRPIIAPKKPNQSYSTPKEHLLSCTHFWIKQSYSFCRSLNLWKFLVNIIDRVNSDISTVSEPSELRSVKRIPPKPSKQLIALNLNLKSVAPAKINKKFWEEVGKSRQVLTYQRWRSVCGQTMERSFKRPPAIPTRSQSVANWERPQTGIRWSEWIGSESMLLALRIQPKECNLRSRNFQRILCVGPRK